MATQAQLAAVQQLYVGYLGRAADSAGQQFWANAIANGTATIASVATGFTLSAEYKAAYGGLTTDALVEKVYNNVLGRTPDAEGKAFWVAALANGKVTADTLVATIVTNLGVLDQQTINNKVFVAQTYTDTVGADYTPAAGSAVLVGVDSTPASVSAAVAAIAGGTLPGQVPALGLINAAKAAQANVTSFEASNKAAADALVSKIAASNKAAGADTAVTKTDDIVANSTYAEKITAVVDDAALARSAVTNAVGGDKDTTVLVSRAATADKAVTNSLAALTSAEKTQASAYVAAVAKEATAKAGAATATEKGAALGGLEADGTATAALANYAGSAKTAAGVYADYVLADGAGRTAIDTAFKDSSFYATFKAAAAKDAAYADAIKATSAAKNALDTDKLDETSVTIGTVNGVAIKGTTDSTAGSDKAQIYVDALAAKTAADALVVKAQAADADVASAKALNDSYVAVTAAATAAGKAVTDFTADGVSVHTLEITAVNGVVTDTVTSATGVAFTGSAAKDVFYFADNSKVVGASDAAINSFGAGDSIVLGSGYTFNSGALTTGNNNALEFFLVKGATGTQVVIETANAGSSAEAGTVVDASGVTLSPNAAVINLVGVTADHLSVANGVISYV